MKQKTKFCVDCKHSSHEGYYLYSCRADSVQEYNMVTGDRCLHHCNVLRGVNAACGPDALLFEEKPKTPSLWVLIKELFGRRNVAAAVKENGHLTQDVIVKGTL
jgi:hypothetical protein